MNTPFELSHIALIVHDPRRTAALLEDVFDAKALQRRDGHGNDEVHLHIGGVRLVLVAADVERPLTGDHVAFHTDAAQLRVIAGKLERMGHACQMARSDTALYFQDFDNHVFEIECAAPDAERAGRDQRPRDSKPVPRVSSRPRIR